MNILSTLIVDDEDLLLISLEGLKTNRRVSHNQKKHNTPFNLANLTDDYCWIHFRFLKSDLERLKIVLGIPDVLKCRKRVTVGGMEALCILLKRLSYPNR